MNLRETDLEFEKEPVRYPGRYEVTEAVLLRDGRRVPVVVKKTPSGRLERAGRTRADRSLAIARTLIARGIPTPEPIGVVHREGESWYVSRRLEEAAQVREWFLHRDDPSWGPPRLGLALGEVLRAVGRLARKMHDSGVFYRDLSDGNVLVTREGAGISIWLVDLTRASLKNRPVRLWNRLRDLARLGLNRSDDRKTLLESYYAPASPPAGVDLLLSLFRKRIVLWDDMKARLRPWKKGPEP